jgi:hypothetical protein
MRRREFIALLGGDGSPPQRTVTTLNTALLFFLAMR